jgi:hypothetical protein
MNMMKRISDVAAEIAIFAMADSLVHLNSMAGSLRWAEHSGE